MTAPEIAKLGRACGSLDAQHDTEVYGLTILETSLWREWSEESRRLWEYAYHQARSAAVRRSA